MKTEEEFKDFLYNRTSSGSGSGRSISDIHFGGGHKIYRNFKEYINSLIKDHRFVPLLCGKSYYIDIREFYLNQGRMYLLSYSGRLYLFPVLCNIRLNILINSPDFQRDLSKGYNWLILIKLGKSLTSLKELQIEPFALAIHNLYNLTLASMLYFHYTTEYNKNFICDDRKSNKKCLSLGHH